MKILRRAIIWILVVLLLSSVKFRWCWIDSVPGDPPTVPYEFVNFIGFQAGLVATGWEDTFIYSGFDFEFHAPRFHPWFVRAGWFDFGIVGAPVWLCALLLLFVWQFCRYGARRWKRRGAA